MDIDGFKAINDTYGHKVGDHALREVATALQGGLRPYDLCVRYAGDEFIIVLADCSRETAEAKRRELQQRVTEIKLEVRPGKLLPLAASAGASVFPADGTHVRSAARRRRPSHVSRQDRTPRRRSVPARAGRRVRGCRGLRRLGAGLADSTVDVG